MTDKASERYSHASCDYTHRRRKADKIIGILKNVRALQGLRVLEIGTGSGVIAACFSEHVGSMGEVVAVDVIDQRILTDGYEFYLVKDAHLPFPQASFDIIISNHVIEHVRDRAEQRTHLSEIRRVLRDDGLGYLATPNRWAIIEPHYGLPFLIWLPLSAATNYLRATRKGSVYDCVPLGPLSLRQAMRATDIQWETMASQAVTTMSAIEGHKTLRWIAANVPSRVIKLLSVMLPTMVFILTKSKIKLM